MPCTSAAVGWLPFLAPLLQVNSTSVVNTPAGVILKTVPSPLVPPPSVVPKKLPPLLWTSSADGEEPLVPFTAKFTSVVSTPVEIVILKTVPLLPVPPLVVVPYKFPSVPCTSPASG